MQLIPLFMPLCSLQSCVPGMTFVICYLLFVIIFVIWVQYSFFHEKVNSF